MLFSSSATPARSSSRVGGVVLFLATLAAFGGQAAMAQSTNRLESIQAQATSGDKVELTLRLSEPAPTPLTFTVDNPARIALDLPATSVAMTSRRVDVKQGVLDTVNVAEANGRTRVVLNVDSLVPYETRVQGNTIIVSLSAAGSGRALQSSAAPGGLAVASQRAADQRTDAWCTQRQQHRLPPRRRWRGSRHRRADRLQGAGGPAPGRRPHRRQLRQDHHPRSSVAAPGRGGLRDSGEHGRCGSRRRRRPAGDRRFRRL